MPRRPEPALSLRSRLTVFVAAALVISAALAFAVVYVSTGSQLRDQADRDLRGDVTQFVEAVRPDESIPLARAYNAVTRYVGAQPYSATSQLLFVLIPGLRPISSQHTVLAAETGRGESGDSWAVTALTHPRAGYLTSDIPGVGSASVLERRVRIAGRASVVAVAEPLAYVSRAQHGIARAFVLAAVLSLVLAILAAYAAGARATAPLRRMAAVAARVDAGDLEPRMEETTGHGREIHVLADAFNHMLDRLSDAFTAQRAFIADASHELRTPLTVIRGQLELLATSSDPPDREVERVERVVQSEVTRMTRLVDDLLLLTVAEQHDFLQPETIDLRPFVDELWDGLSLTADRQFDIGAIPPGLLHADPDRLAQALRNLARNAIEVTAPTTGRVRIEAEAIAGGRLRLAVVDDGPGIPADERERVFERLYRTDPSRTRGAGGSGLGLAIVRAIAVAHGGEVEAVAPVDGRGARVELTLPNFDRAPVRAPGELGVAAARP